MEAQKTEVTVASADGALEDVLEAPVLEEYRWMMESGDRRLGTPGEFRVAAEALVAVRSRLREIEAEHDPAVKAAHATHKAAVKLKTDAAATLPAIESALAEKVAHYLRVYAVDDNDLAQMMIPVNPAVPMVEGLGWQVRYRPVVRDARKLVRAIARGSVPLDAIAINDRWLRERVTALREAFSLPGVEYEVFVVPMVTEPKG